MHVDTLPTPALLLDLEILEHNLATMQRKAEKHKVKLRPHIKTHKSLEIARRQRELGAKGITVSTFFEVQQFAAAGFDDITWALPIPFPYVHKVLDLPEEVTVGITVDSMDAIEHVVKICTNRGKKLHVWLEIDCGQHRSGVDPRSPHAEEMVRLLGRSPAIAFDGVLTHGGHSYGGRVRDDLKRFAEEERSVTVGFADAMREKGYTVENVSVGSTPTMSATENLKGVDEIRPGNYAFYDYTQASIGSCGVADCALSVLATVISHQPDSLHFVTDAGALALSKDPGPTHVRNDMGMGILFEDYERKRLHAHLQLTTLSQEHGKVVADKIELINDRFKVGDRVRILEHHSCLTAAQFDKYYVVKGNDVVDQWSVLRGRI